MHHPASMAYDPSRTSFTRHISALQELVVTISPKLVPQSFSAKDDVS